MLGGIQQNLWMIRVFVDFIFVTLSLNSFFEIMALCFFQLWIADAVVAISGES